MMKPGTNIAAAHWPQFKDTPVNLVMKSSANKFGAIAVANKKDVTFVAK